MLSDTVLWDRPQSLLPLLNEANDKNQAWWRHGDAGHEESNVEGYAKQGHKEHEDDEQYEGVEGDEGREGDEEHEDQNTWVARSTRKE